MIRPALPSDEPVIRRCAELAYAPYSSLIGRKPAPMLADYAAQIDAGCIHVATDDEHEVLGFIVFYADRQHMLIENVAVLPDAAGKGVGKSLIVFCEETARRQGFAVVALYTNEKMTQNLSLYPRLGYQEVARRHEDGFSRVFFEKHL